MLRQKKTVSRLGEGAKLSGSRVNGERKRRVGNMGREKLAFHRRNLGEGFTHHKGGKREGQEKNTIGTASEYGGGFPLGSTSRWKTRFLTADQHLGNHSREIGLTGLREKKRPL